MSEARSLDEKARWSKRRWLIGLAALMVVTLLAYGLLLRRRYDRRVAFERKMTRYDFQVAYGAGWSGLLARVGIRANSVPALTGEPAIVIYAGKPPAFLNSRERLKAGLEQLPACGESCSLVLAGEYVDDEVLRSIPTAFEIHRVDFLETTVTENGLRKFLGRHRPALVCERGRSSLSPRMKRLQAEFPHLEFTAIR